jgi:hypothetical protein
MAQSPFIFPYLQQVAGNAQIAGLDVDTRVDSTKSDCPLNAANGQGRVTPIPEKQPTYEYCNLKTLQIHVNAPDKDLVVTLDHVRLTEPVDPSTAWRYQSVLTNRDIVIETLADIRATTSEAEVSVLKPSDSHWNADKSSKGNRPLTIIAQATNSCTHTSFSPQHPLICMDAQNGSLTLAEGGAMAQSTYYSVQPTLLDDGLAALWPFSGTRIRDYTVKAHSCGRLPIPQRTTSDLSAQIYVLPYEEWGITLGIDPKSSGSTSVTKYRGEQDGDSGRTINRTTTIKKQDGNREISTTTQEMTTKTGIERTRVTDESKTLSYSVLESKSQSIKAVEEDWYSQTKWSAPKPEEEYRKVKITHKVAGRELETDFSKTIKAIFEFKSLLDEIQKVFDSVKFGASFSTEYELLSGEISLGFGNKWPKAYAEDNRVYYVDHYIFANGTLNVFDAKVTGFCGLAVKSPSAFIDFAIEIGGYLSAVIKTPITANINHTWGKDTSSWTGTLDCSPSFKLEGGFKANGRAFGYSVDGKVALEETISFTMEGEISTLHPLTVKSSLIFGTEGDDSTEAKPEYAAVRLVAELKTVGSSVHTWKIKPYVLINGAVAWKDYYLIGEKPKD